MVVRDFKPGAPVTVTNDTGISTGHSISSGAAAAHDDPDSNLADNWTNVPRPAGHAATRSRAAATATSSSRASRSVAAAAWSTASSQALLSADKKPVFAYHGTRPAATGNCPLAFGALIRELQRLLRDGRCRTRRASRAGITDVDAYNNTLSHAHAALHDAPGACAGQTANTYVYDSNSRRPTDTPYASGRLQGLLADRRRAGRHQVHAECSGGAARTTSTSRAKSHHWFQFDTAAPPTLIFTGDDDVWVFIKGTLVLDLGGIHARGAGQRRAERGGQRHVTVRPATHATRPTISTSAQNGSIYEIIVFQAERNTCESNYRLSLQNFNLPEVDLHAGLRGRHSSRAGRGV